MDHTFNELASGIYKSFENASNLFKEAIILNKNKSFARSVVLHQISLEECAKLEIIGHELTNYLMTGKGDFKKLQKKFNHQSKNYTNAYFLEASEEESIASTAGNFSDWEKAFSKLQNEFHTISNTNKNAGLYVNLQGEKFLSPKESITKEMLKKIKDLNKKILRDVAIKVSMVKSWHEDPLKAKDRIKSFDIKEYLEFDKYYSEGVK
jgi:AbiV family abortive infection protein